MTMLNRVLGLIFVVALTACTGDSEVRRQEYLDADYYTRLELPPDLTAPEASRAIRIPQPSERATTQFQQATRNIGESEQEDTVVSGVAVQAAQARLHADASGTWLQVDKTADVVWGELKTFWEREGIVLKRSQPELGLMETDWVSKLQMEENAGFFARIFSNFEPDRVDRFTLRLQQSNEGTGSRVYITHAGMEVVVEGEDVNWRSREREPALEAEMLQRLALFIGNSQADAGLLLEHYFPFASRVRLAANDTTALEVIGDLNKVWQRTTAALDSMQVEVVDQNKQQGTMAVRFTALDPQLRGEEYDEIAESSWLMNLFRDKPEDGASEHITLRMTQLEQFTRVEIVDAEGELASSVIAEQFGESLFNRLQ